MKDQKFTVQKSLGFKKRGIKNNSVKKTVVKFTAMRGAKSDGSCNC